ncbi:MAG: cytochrome ubiquinol oxidase subunit I [Anaerolineales bacterium]|jgi:cytochrome d ubiquinol oxidase subunit I|nr:cytochrome ubiquinol oxidase subunit I [Anaerolineales bacterium]
MDPVTLARLQFTITCVYHFFFVPLTLGLSILIALMETMYVRTGDELYKRMTKFWGKLFLINFAMGVVTGIVMEFQFGMNWSEYSRFVGDVFGAPLAIEALLAFFLESTFLGIWIFGWDRLSPRMHAATIWMVAIGSNLSALWILVANSFMQEPVGFAIENGRAVMTDFFALLSNPHVWVQFPHVITSGLTTAAFFLLGISAYHLFYKKSNSEIFHRSFKWGAIAGVIGICLVGLGGHSQAQYMVEAQPMKMAAGEALWQTDDPADLSLVTIIDEDQQRNVFDIRIPRALSLLAYNRFDGEVKGIKDIQQEYEVLYGPGNYIPPVTISYWSFRAMVGVGSLMLLLAFYALFLVLTDRLPKADRFLRWMPFAIALPILGTSTGWIFTEVARQPWIVFGIMRTEDAISPNVTVGMLLTSLIVYTLLYGVLIVVDVYLLAKYAKDDPATNEKIGDTVA